jgi:hypothetical protein
MIFDENESIVLGALDPEDSFFLKHIRVKILIKKISVITNEVLTLNLLSTNNTVLESDSIILSELDYAGIDGAGSDFMGWIRFDFNDYPLMDASYNLSLTITNYVRDTDTSFIAAVYDYKQSTNNVLDIPFNNGSFEVFYGE